MWNSCPTQILRLRLFFNRLSMERTYYSYSCVPLFFVWSKVDKNFSTNMKRRWCVLRTICHATVSNGWFWSQKPLFGMTSFEAVCGRLRHIWAISCGHWSNLCSIGDFSFTRSCLKLNAFERMFLCFLNIISTFFSSRLYGVSCVMIRKKSGKDANMSYLFCSSFLGFFIWKNNIEHDFGRFN